MNESTFQRKTNWLSRGIVTCDLSDIDDLKRIPKGLNHRFRKSGSHRPRNSVKTPPSEHSTLKKSQASHSPTLRNE